MYDIVKKSNQYYLAYSPFSMYLIQCKSNYDFCVKNVAHFILTKCVSVVDIEQKKRRHQVSMTSIKTIHVTPSMYLVLKLRTFQVWFICEHGTSKSPRSIWDQCHTLTALLFIQRAQPPF